MPRRFRSDHQRANREVYLEADGCSRGSDQSSSRTLSMSQKTVVSWNPQHEDVIVRLDISGRVTARTMTWRLLYTAVIIQHQSIHRFISWSALSWDLISPFSSFLLSITIESLLSALFLLFIPPFKETFFDGLSSTWYSIQRSLAVAGIAFWRDFSATLVGYMDELQTSLCGVQWLGHWRILSTFIFDKLRRQVTMRSTRIRSSLSLSLSPETDVFIRFLRSFAQGSICVDRGLEDLQNCATTVFQNSRNPREQSSPRKRNDRRRTVFVRRMDVSRCIIIALHTPFTLFSSNLSLSFFFKYTILVRPLS